MSGAPLPAIGVSEAAMKVPQARVTRGLPALAVAIVAMIAASTLAPQSGYILNIVMQAATYAIGVAGIVVVLG
jgi:branched-chain amino acid transport system permease protein